MNGRLPPEDGSDWPETWPKRVSDDSQHFIFRHQKQIFDEKYYPKCLQNMLFQRRKMKYRGLSEMRFPKFEAERSHPRGVNGRSKIQLFRHPKTSNGRKITRIARISTIFRPNESSQRDLFLEKFSKERNGRKVFEKFEIFSIFRISFSV